MISVIGAGPLPADDPLGGALGNFSAVANNFSALAAVLAGFAFACVISLVLTPRGQNHGATAAAMKAVPAMTAAFVGLVLISVNYAAIGGEKDASPRLATMEVFAGVGFTTAGILLPYVILVLLAGVLTDYPSRREPLERSVRFLRFCICFAGPLLMLLQYAAMHDATALGRTYAVAGVGRSDVLAWLTIGLLIVNSIGAYSGWWARVPLLRRLWSLASARPDRTLWFLCRGAVVLSILSIASVRVVMFTLEPGDAAPNWALFGGSALFAVFATLVTWSAMTYSAADGRPVRSRIRTRRGPGRQGGGAT